MLMKSVEGLWIRADFLHDIQSVKSVWSILHSQFEAYALPILEGSKKDIKWIERESFVKIK